MRRMFELLVVSVLAACLALGAASLLPARAAPSGRALDLSDSSELLGCRHVNLNTTTDQPITMKSDRYVVLRVTLANPSANPTLAVGGIYSAPSKGGTALVPATQVYTGLSAANRFITTGLNAVLSTTVATASTLYFSLTTAQGSACSADLFIYGDDVDRD